ncbi:MAG: hypothetical protein WAM97_02655 [Acidimicrobiales bacterium]
MIHAKRGALQGVALSVALIAGVIGSVAAFSSPALAASTAGTKTKTTTYTLSCKTGIANGDVSVKTTQTYPASVAPGAKFKITWSSVTTVEGTLASAAYTLAPGGKEDGTVTTDNDLSSDGTPATNNIAGKKGIAESGTISSPSSFTIDTPTTGTISTPSFTAGTAGTDTISAQDDDANITIYNSSGSKVATTTADCSPTGNPTTIAKVKVT